MLRLARHPRYHWLVDNSLGLDVPSRHKISGFREIALLAAKRVPRFSVCLRDKLTLWTSSTRVFWVNLDNAYAQELRFVFNKAFQLMETPIAHSSSLRLSGLNPFSNAPQIFKGNSRGQAFSRSYNVFTDAMVSIFLISFLFAGNLFKFSLCRPLKFVKLVS